MRREIGLLANRLMVPSILESRKTVTRRMIVPEPSEEVTFFEKIIDGRNKGKWAAQATGPDGDTEVFASYKCPFGEPGDLLWVREEHTLHYVPSTMKFRCEYLSGEPLEVQESVVSTTDRERLFTRQTINTGRVVAGRYLPKCLARTWLMVTDVRVERLQDITDAEALREGVQQLEGYFSPTWKHYGDDGSNYHVALTPRFSFITLIQHLHGEDIWDKNPWVWVVGFKTIGINGRPVVRDPESFWGNHGRNRKKEGEV